MRRRHLFSYASALGMPVLAVTLLAAPMVAVPAGPAAAQFGVGLNITIAPPILPIYEPPPLPGPGYIFTPGYWGYGEGGYFWVSGNWVQPPSVGLLWTPGYWGFNNGIYAFNGGYWGSHVGFYGGINYGFGYGGNGFLGGEWRGGQFAYNSAAYGGQRFFNNTNITNVYNRTIINNNVTRVAFNGPNGVNARATATELAVGREQRVAAVQAQVAHQQAAARNPEMRAAVNHGTPPIAATQRPGKSRGAGAGAGAAAGAPHSAAAGRPGLPAAHPALRSPSPGPSNGGTARPAVTRAPAHTATGRPSGMGGPRPMNTGGPRPGNMGGPRPGNMGGPRPMNMGAPHPMAAPHAAPGGGGGGHPGPGPHHG